MLANVQCRIENCLVVPLTTIMILASHIKTVTVSTVVDSHYALRAVLYIDSVSQQLIDVTELCRQSNEQ